MFSEIREGICGYHRAYWWGWWWQCMPPPGTWAPHSRAMTSSRQWTTPRPPGLWVHALILGRAVCKMLVKTSYYCNANTYFINGKTPIRTELIRTQEHVYTTRLSVEYKNGKVVDVNIFHIQLGVRLFIVKRWANSVGRGKQLLFRLQLCFTYVMDYTYWFDYTSCKK